MAEQRQRSGSEFEIEESLTQLAINESLRAISRSPAYYHVNSNDNDEMVAELLQEEEYDGAVLPTDEEIAMQIQIEQELNATRGAFESERKSFSWKKKPNNPTKQISRPNVSPNPENHQRASNSDASATIEAINRDFGPEDYELLLSLDASTRKKPISQSDLHRLPVEVFKPSHNQTVEERNCSICLTDYEQYEQLRRLSCFHVFHQECIDKWLKEENVCPVCRLPPTKQS